MASILESNIIKYVCACGHLNPISKLYFCRYCLKLRCGYCVCSQVDSHFCCNCLENIPSTEAKFKKNRCNKCFDCPSCQHTLSSRANTVQVVLPRKPEDAAGKETGTPPTASKSTGKDGKEKEPIPISRKMYYLICLNCRWTSRDVGIPDQTVATGQWPELEYAHATRFSLLLEHYQNVVLQDKQEKHDFWRRKTPKQHKYPSLTDRTGLTVSMARRQLGWSDKATKPSKEINIKSSVAAPDVDDLPDNIFTHEIKLSSITTLKQRLNNPSVQPYTVNNLYPQHKSLSIKRSVRCRQCEHYVIKPEYNPNSIKYRIHLLASYHVPEVRLMKMCGGLKEGESSQVLLKFINPTMHDMNITLLALPTADEERGMIEEIRNKFDKQLTVANICTPITSSTTTYTALAAFVEIPKPVSEQITGTVALPEGSFLVNHRDDTADFDEEIQIPDDPKFVAWRRSNKVAIELTVNPLTNTIGDEVIVGFTMQYNHLNTFPNAPDKKETQEHALTSRVYVRIGKVQS